MTVFDEHHHYVSDQVRISAYRKALQELIRPTDVVLDFASGTGILGMLACEAGAARVYSVEVTSLIGVARQITAKNGFEDRIKFIKGFSTSIELPEKVDVIVADQIGFFGQSSGMIGELLDLSQRFLKPGGVVIPNSLDFWVAPIECPELREVVDFWSLQSTGFDLSPLRPLAVNTAYPKHLKSENILAEPYLGASLQLPSAGDLPLRIDKEFNIARKGVLHGIAGWFSAQLSPSVSMTNSPLASHKMNRHLKVCPIEDAISVAAGDRVRLRMLLRPADQSVSWVVEVLCPESDSLARRRVFRHSTLKGILLCREDLDRRKPDYTPTASELGKVTAYVLALCDGAKTVREIEESLQKQFPSLCPTPADAGTLATSILAKYAADRD